MKKVHKPNPWTATNWPADLQFWLQGHARAQQGLPARPWAFAWLGNRISDLRYWAWRARGGKW